MTRGGAAREEAEADRRRDRSRRWPATCAAAAPTRASAPRCKKAAGMPSDEMTDAHAPRRSSPALGLRSAGSRSARDVAARAERTPARAAADAEQAAQASTRTSFVHVAPDGAVDDRLPPLGDGAGHAQLAAGADRRRARRRHGARDVVQADGDEKYGDQNTDGSTQHPQASTTTLRRAGAAARMMLVAAAAKRWKVKPRDLHGARTTRSSTRRRSARSAFGDARRRRGEAAGPDEGRRRCARRAS